MLILLEVIYPQVPLRIPCYDLAPLTYLWFDSAKKRSLTKNKLG